MPRKDTILVFGAWALIYFIYVKKFKKPRDPDDPNADSLFGDTPFEFQTHLHDPASISMEGILMFNKHLLFLVIVIVMFVGWLLVFTVYYRSIG